MFETILLKFWIDIIFYSSVQVSLEFQDIIADGILRDRTDEWEPCDIKLQIKNEKFLPRFGKFSVVDFANQSSTSFSSHFKWQYSSIFPWIQISHNEHKSMFVICTCTYVSLIQSRPSRAASWHITLWREHSFRIHVIQSNRMILCEWNVSLVSLVLCKFTITQYELRMCLAIGVRIERCKIEFVHTLCIGEKSKFLLYNLTW